MKSTHDGNTQMPQIQANTAAIRFKGKPTEAIFFMLTRLLPKIIALGGVAMGSMKAQLLAMVIGIIAFSKYCLVSIFTPVWIVKTVGCVKMFNSIYCGFHLAMLRKSLFNMLFLSIFTKSRNLYAIDIHFKEINITSPLYT